MKPNHTLTASRGSRTRLLTLAAALCTFAGAGANAQLTGTFNTPADILVTASSYTATGTMALTLNCALPTGTDLTIVNNTSRAFITGSFSNLVQGKAVTLRHGGLTYEFIVNYYGGTGNDLVLQWAKTRTLVWGFNGSGQFGNGSTVSSSNPVEFFPGEQVTASAAGGQHSLALHADGTVTAAGLGYRGQLGDNTIFSDSYTMNPVAVNTAIGVSALFGKRVIALAAGYQHSSALCSDGTVASWGSDASGQAGTNRVGDYYDTAPFLPHPVAVDVTGVLKKNPIVAITSGSEHNLALCADGKLVSWGRNDIGQLGNSSNQGSAVAVSVNQSGALLGKSVVALATGYAHNLALCTDGTVVAWGAGNGGQLGNNTFGASQVPVKVVATGALARRKVIAIAAGNELSMALCADGTVVTWGNDYGGCLGTNNTGPSSVPVKVNTSQADASALYGKTVIAIAAGLNHCMALCSDGTLATWGWNSSGQLGDGTLTDSPLPVKANIGATLNSGERVVRISSGSMAQHSMATVAMPPLPGALTQAATSITATSATLNGKVTPSASGAATISFNFGPTKAYGTIYNSQPHLITGTTSKAVSYAVTGLMPSTTYHFRVNAKGPSGLTRGSDLTFTTPAH